MKKRNFSINLLLVVAVFILLLSTGSCKDRNKDSKEKPEIKITSVIEELYVNEAIKLEAYLTPTKEEYSIIWEVSDPTLVDLSDNILTPIKVGELTITASCKEYPEVKDSLSCQIKKRAVESLEINTKTTQIYMGETLNLEVLVYPYSANQSFTWTILDNQIDWEVATLEGNTLTANKYGLVYLTATSEENFYASDSITIEVLHPLLEEENYIVEHIKGAPGENAATDFCIQYSTYNTQTYALLTKADDVNFENAIKYEGTGYYFEEYLPTGEEMFKGRNVWRINIFDLEENTSYIYKINQGNDTYSEVYNFKTAGGDSKTSFLYITDTHYYTGTTGTTASAAVSENIIFEAMEANPNISFILDGGDLIDTGGNSKIWDIYFNYATSLKYLPFIGVPGNHEYYHDHRKGDNTYFKLYNANPLNGPEDSKGSTSWFIHNETLFILVDIVSSKGYDERMEWIENLLETKEYKYSIFVMHYPLHNDNTDYDGRFIKLFDKYNVDLVLSGHYHSESLKKYYYQDNPTSDHYLGTCYLTGAYSGIKGAPSPDEAINTARGYIIDINENTIDIQIIYANGQLGKSWSIDERPCNEVYEATKDELKASIEHEYLKESSQLLFTWSKAFYGNVKKLYFKELNQNVINESVVFPNSSYTSIKLDNVIEGFDYLFEIKILYADGTEETFYTELNLHIPINLTAVDYDSTYAVINHDQLNDSLKYKVYKFKVYVNNEFVGEYKYLEKGVTKTSYTIYNLKPNTEYEIKFVASDRNDKEIYFSDTLFLKTPE